jgi:hypothetical protein
MALRKRRARRDIFCGNGCGHALIGKCHAYEIKSDYVPPTNLLMTLANHSFALLQPSARRLAGQFSHLVA